MTREQLIDTFAKYVFPLIRFDNERAKLDYADSIFGFCGRYDGLKFNECVKHVMSAWKSTHKPQAGHFIDAYKFLAKEHGWYVEEQRICKTCNGSGWKKIRVTRMQDNGVIHDAVTGCPACRPNFTKLKDDLILVETAEAPVYAKPYAPPAALEFSPTPINSLDPPPGIIDDDLPVEEDIPL